MAEKKVIARGHVELVKLLKELAKKLKKTPDFEEFVSKHKVTEWEIRKCGGYIKLLRMAKLPPPEDKVSKLAIDTYLEILKSKKMCPTNSDMAAKGFSPDTIRRRFGHINKLKDLVKKLQPAAFKDVIDESLFTPKALVKLQSEASKYKKFVITTAVVGCAVDTNFLKSIDSYCELNDALLLILIAADPAADSDFNLDPRLKDRYIVVSDIALNQNLFVSTIKLSAKQIDPVTGLGRIGQRSGSFVYASPKQRLKVVATSNTKPPIALMTTGAITKPQYGTQRYMSERTAYIADHDHVLGAIVVELEDDRHFHFRQIQADRSGGFVDLGTFYEGEDTYDMKPKALVMGDYHSGETDKNAERCWLEILEEVGADYAIFHDIFNGLSISHHDKDRQLTLAQRSLADKLNLRKEVSHVALDLNKFTPLVKQAIIVKSNHDEFLKRYLEDGRYVKDPQNHGYSLDIAKAMLDGNDPLAYAVHATKLLKEPNKLRWLSRDEDFKIAKIECGAHGDKGPNGARGASLRSMEEAYGNSVSGHSHTPEILRTAWRVGTSSLLKLDYNEGPSSWMHTSCLVYPNGMRQLINVIAGKWRLDK